MLSIIFTSPSFTTCNAWKLTLTLSDCKSVYQFNAGLITPQCPQNSCSQEITAFLCSTDVTHLKRREVQTPHYHIKRALVALSAGKGNIQELTAAAGTQKYCKHWPQKPLFAPFYVLPLSLCQARIERDSAKWDILQASGWSHTQTESTGDVHQKTSMVNVLLGGHTLVDQPPRWTTNCKGQPNKLDPGEKQDAAISS